MRSPGVAPTRNLRVLLTVASFAQSYGGPALSVSRLGTALATHGADVTLWAPNGSACMLPVGPEDRKVIRLDGPLEAALSAASPDVVHDNGVWLPYNYALARCCRARNLRRIVSPRGMLEPWALRYKRIKKSLAWSLYQKRDLVSADGLHATSEPEAQQLRALGLSRSVHIVPNGTDLPNDTVLALSDKSSLPGQRTALFLSRVHPKKGLPMLIEAWDRLRPPGWRLIIAGPSELGHAEEIAADVHERGLGDQIEIVGPQYGEEKIRLLLASDLFVLPTYSENFGMAIAEALAHGIPVLTTTGAPWHELETRGCGWWVAPEPAAITHGLRDAFAARVETLRAMGCRGRALIRDTYGWDGIAEKMMGVYEYLLRSHERSGAA